MAIERFYIIKDGERDGPFDEAYVRFLLESEELGFDDLCETENGERFRLATMYEALEEGDEEEHEEEADIEELVESSPVAVRKRPIPRGRVLYLGHPSFFKFTMSWLVVIAGVVGGYFLGPHSLWGMLAGFVLAALAVIYILLARMAHVYVITPRRVEAVHGLVAKDSTEIRVEDIRTINVRRSGIPGVLGVGTVDFSSTGDAIDVSFADVWGARRVKRLVRRLQDEIEA